MEGWLLQQDYNEVYTAQVDNDDFPVVLRLDPSLAVHRKGKMLVVETS